MRGFLTNERGSELIEFALVSVLFMLMLFGATIGGLSIYRYNTLSQLAQDGARAASVCGNSSNAAMQGTCGTGALLSTYLQTRSPHIPITVTVQKFSGGSLTTANPKDQAVDTLMQVTVQSSFFPTTRILPTSWSGLSISASSQMRITR